jgi:hypothetical protein
MKLLITLAIILGLSFGLHAQTVTKDAQGNYTAVKAPKIDEKPTDTGKTFTDTKGNVFPVYVSKNGKLFVIRTSKAGNQYKQYLKL